MQRPEPSPGSLRLPRHHEAAVRQRRDRRADLIVRRRRVDDEVVAGRAAVGVVERGRGCRCPSRRRCRKIPRHHEAAVGSAVTGDRLVARRGRVDDEVVAGRGAVGIVEPAADAASPSRRRCRWNTTSPRSGRRSAP